MKIFMSEANTMTEPTTRSSFSLCFILSIDYKLRDLCYLGQLLRVAKPPRKPQPKERKVDNV